MRISHKSVLLTKLLCVWMLALVSVVVLNGASEAAEEAAENADQDEILGLSLEELLEVELDSMAVTGIHHTHERGEWMVGYSFMHMDMHGNRDGTGNLNPGDVIAQGYMVSPTNMDMDMHMFHAMYGITDELTAMLMLPYISKSMDHLRMDGLRFTTNSRGLGDVSMTGLYELVQVGPHRLIGVLGVSFPTGSINERDSLPGMMMMPGRRVRLPYPSS